MTTPDARGYEREITEPVALCRADGTLHPDAVGWSRHPLHDCRLQGWGRSKRWDYWCVTSDDCVLSITYSSIDYLGILSAWFLDRATGETAGVDTASPLGLGVHLPDTVGGGDMAFSGRGLTIGITEEAGGTRLRATAASKRSPQVEADVLVALPDGHETLSVVVPWSDREFQYTSKHNTRPATGSVRVGDTIYAFGPDNASYGCLDYGRGRWPYRVVWNWGSASGRTGGHVVGLQFGGKWTDGTGSTENGLCIDGRLHKISEELVWEYARSDWLAPWHITSPRSDRVRLRFEPEHEKPSKLDIGVLGTEVHQCFGRWSGTVVTDAGDTVDVDGLFGWAEEARMRW